MLSLDKKLADQTKKLINLENQSQDIVVLIEEFKLIMFLV